VEQRWLEGLDAYEEAVSGGAAHHTRSRLTLLCQTAAGTSVPPRPQSCAAACTRGSVESRHMRHMRPFQHCTARPKPPTCCSHAKWLYTLSTLAPTTWALPGVSSMVCAHTW